jgi:hypothetical protein
MSATEVAVLLDDRPGVNIEVFFHPVVLAFKGTECIDALAANDVHKEAFGLVEVWHREADVIGSPHSR